MNRDAVKFTDLDTFLSIMERMGYNGEIKDLIYEQGKLPYCSAYFVPTDLLPDTLYIDNDTLDQFGGTLAKVEEIRYLGFEEFTTDFMVFPLSLRGYVEVRIATPVTFAPETIQNKWTTGEMIFIINLEDGGGKEFYLTQSGRFVGLTDRSDEEPQPFKTLKQAGKRMDQLRERYPETCRIYTTEQRDFDARRKLLQGSTTE